MKASESLDAVMAKYNRLCARYRDLEQQSSEKQEKWGELEHQFRINESLMRELCELILAKDPSEMRLGTEYSWGKLSTREIIQKSKNVFTNYNNTRTSLLRDIQRQSEERRVMIESLQIQIEQTTHAMDELRKLQSLREENISESIDAVTGEIKEITKESIPSEETMKRVALSTQQAAERGDVEVVTDDSEITQPSAIVTDIPISPTSKKNRKRDNKPVVANLKIWEESRDVSAADIVQQVDIAEQAVIASVKRSGNPVVPAKGKSKAVAEHKAAAEKQFVTIDISKTASKMNNRHWAIMEVIGSTGMCEGGSIVDAATEMINQSDTEKITSGGLRYILMNLVNFGVLETDTSVNHPLKNRFAVYSLSPIGSRLYKDHFGKDPMPSERDKLIAEHDNLEHGFGIKALKEILEQSGNYFDVSMNRSENTFRLKDGTSFIPDIVAQTKIRGNMRRVYMEYERGTHHQTDFNIKLNKAMKQTRFLDITSPTNEVATHLKDMVLKWVESRGGAKVLKGNRIRITTLRRLKDVANIHNDSNWMYVFDFNNGEEPVEHLLGKE